MRKLVITSLSLILATTLVGCNLEEKEADKTEQDNPTEVKQEELVETVGTIKEVRNEESKQFLLVETSDGEMVFHVQDSTELDPSIQLEVGSVIKVKHTRVMTRSMPPQVNAVSIESNEMTNIELETSIEEVIQKENRTSIKVKKDGEDVIFHIDENTKLAEGLELEKGQRIKIEHAPVFTLSLPAQGYAASIELIEE